MNIEEAESTRPDYDFSKGFLVPAGTLDMQVRVLAGLGFITGIAADQDPAEVEMVRSRIGWRIQSEVRAYVQALLRDDRGEYGIFDSRGERIQRFPVGNSFVLDIDGECNLYRSGRVRWGHEIGNPPLGPDEWLRNADGILRVMGNITRSIRMAGER